MSIRFKRVLAIILCIVIVVAVWLMFVFRPQANRKGPPKVARISVEVDTLKAADYALKIRSYGRVNALRQSELSSQVAGRVVYVAESMRSGGFFEKGEVLVKIEDTDYQAQLQVAYASLVQAEQNLAEEQALAQQAKEDWRRLGNQGEASALVMREPQLAAAQAQFESAKANYQLAQVNLQRTQIVAPYQGRVLTKNVDIGQVVSSNTVVGEVYSTDALEIELPVKNNEIPLLDLPENYLDQSRDSELKVTIISNLAGQQKWQGKIVRTASSIDDETRQLHLIARIEDPFGEKAHGRMPLKIGQYVTAEILAKPIPQAIVLQNKSIYQGQYVYLYQEGVIQRQNIDILWQNQEVAVIRSGLKSGDKIVMTPLGQVISGTPVNIKGQKPQGPANRPQKRNKDGKS